MTNDSERRPSSTSVDPLPVTLGQVLRLRALRDSLEQWDDFVRLLSKREGR